MWTRWGKAPWPARDEARLIDTFGLAEASRLLPRIRELEEEFYAADAQFVVSDLQTMGAVAAEQFSNAHPELAAEAVRALAWCYTYDFK